MKKHAINYKYQYNLQNLSSEAYKHLTTADSL